jgi:hypothetical protein
VLDHHHFLFTSDWLISTFTPRMIVSRGAKSACIYPLHLLRAAHGERKRERGRGRERERERDEFARPRFYIASHGEHTSFR